MAKLKLELDEIINNPKARVIIAIPKPSGTTTKSTRISARPIIGFLQGDISLSGSNEFNNPFDNAAANDLNSKLQGLSSILGRFGLTKGVAQKEKPL